MACVRQWWPLIVLVLLTACQGFVYDEVLDGPFRLVAVDTYDDMALCRSVKNAGDNKAGDCVGDGLAGGPTIFQVGWNAKYVVAARHPSGRFEQPNRAITEYYYIVRAPSDVDIVRPVNQIGPLDVDQFNAEKQRLTLPEFTRVIQSLK